MKLAVFTPSHNPKWLDQAYASLDAQTHTDWEWFVLLNNGRVWRNQEAKADPRIHIISTTEKMGVGRAKSAVIQEIGGGFDVYVELDHDDILTVDCLQKVDTAFQDNPDAVFVYSDTAEINDDGTNHVRDFPFPASSGWNYRDEDVQFGIPGGETVTQTVLALDSMEPTVHNVSLIWFAPNHVRAFTAAAYASVGGYDESLVVLDDQSLMMRLYGAGDFIRIPEVLYLQRMHGKNTQYGKLNAQIQTGTVQMYEDEHTGVQKLAMQWAERSGLACVDLGCGNTKPEGYIGFDIIDGPSVDIIGSAPDLPFQDNSVGVFRAVDFLEHVEDKIAMMNEIYRCLAPGGFLLSMTPSTRGNGAFQDPMHVSFWNRNSFWYYSKSSLATASPQTGELIEARFQISQCREYLASNEEDNIWYVQANLIAIKSKDQPRNGGWLEVTAPDA